MTTLPLFWQLLFFCHLFLSMWQATTPLFPNVSLLLTAFLSAHHLLTSLLSGQWLVEWHMHWCILSLVICLTHVPKHSVPCLRLGSLEMDSEAENCMLTVGKWGSQYGERIGIAADLWGSPELGWPLYSSISQSLAVGGSLGGGVTLWWRQFLSSYQ